MERKKVLYVITKSNWGGAQRYVYDLACGAKADFEVVVALGGSGPLKQKLEEKNIRVISVNAFQRDVHLLKESVAFFELVKLLISERPDIVHLNSSKAAGLGALSARLVCNATVIFTAHGLPFKEPVGKLKQELMYFFTWLTIFLSHKTIVISKEDKMIGSAMWLVERKIQYIPIRMKRINFFPADQAKTTLWPKPYEYFLQSIRLVSIAELTKNKGLEYSIKMMEELQKQYPDKYTYTIFGEGEGQTNLKQYSDKILNSKKQPIINYGNILEYDYPNLQTQRPKNLSTTASKYLKAFNIFILPSVKEGMPYVLLEAAAAGLPIIATTVVEQEARDLPNITFVPPGDGNALAQAVEKVTVQKQESNASSPTVRSFDHMLEETYKLYS